MRRTLRRCVLILSDALILCIEALSAPLFEAEEKAERAERKPGDPPGWLQEAKEVDPTR